MAQQPTLVILAAGIGSRYGGFKQIEPLGPGGEISLDYAAFDAWRAGFGRLVLIIRPELEEPLRKHLAGKLDGRMTVAFVHQELSDLPPEYSLPPERTKPWGTGHALRSVRHLLQEPFAVINADDFYGPRSYRVLAEFLRGAADSGTAGPSEFAMVGFPLAKTLSRHGTVSRGICRVDAAGFLAGVDERTRIGLNAGVIRFQPAGGDWETLPGDAVASMNMWGFTPALFPVLETQFLAFLRAHGRDSKAEFFIPAAVDALLRAGSCRVRVLTTDEQWFGMTYPQDRAEVQDSIRALTARGVYPASLWGRG